MSRARCCYYLPIEQAWRKSKWIEASGTNEPAPDVACRALEARLKTVRYWLPLAAEESQVDVENVHQLRVSSRRASAAMHLFDSMLPGKRSRWFRKKLKALRETAGEARDLDVLAKRLNEECSANGQPGCGALIERIANARQAAQPAIRDVYEALRSSGFRRRIRKLVQKTKWRIAEQPVPTYLQAAQAGLRPLAVTFFTASEGDFENILALHEFRIAGKKLRYAMEIFAAAFGPSFRKELYPMVEELQEKLGVINDHANHRDRYLAWLDETDDEAQRLLLSKLIGVETSALQTTMRDFRLWWTPQRAAELKALFWREVAGNELRCA